jgi:peptidoglycan hydrolase FlgJ
MPLSPLNALSPQAAETPADRAERLSAMSLAKGGNTKALSRLSPEQQVKSAAGQFEAILLRQFLEDSVSKIMGGESGGPTGNVYGYLLTDVLANQLSAGGGMGLSSILEKQLSPRTAPTAGEQKPTP